MAKGAVGPRGRCSDRQTWIDGRRAKGSAGQKMRARPLAARGFRQHKAMARTIRRDGIAVGDFDGRFHQVVEVLERVFQSFYLGQGHGHVNAHLKECVSKADRNPQFGSEPADAHHIRHLPVDVQKIRALGHQKLAFA